MIERCAGMSLVYLVIVTDDLARRADMYVEFLFLLRPEKTYVPIPDIQFRGHQPVGFPKADLPLQVNLFLFLYVENN